MKRQRTLSYMTKREANIWYQGLQGLRHRARKFDNKEFLGDWAMNLFWGWCWSHES